MGKKGTTIPYKSSVRLIKDGQHFFNNRGSHAIYRLEYLYICNVVKRKSILKGQFAESLRDLHFQLAAKFGIEIIEQQIKPDHVRIRFTAHPTLALANTLNNLKTVTSRLMFSKHPELAKSFDGHRFWARSYLLTTQGNLDTPEINAYLKSNDE